MSGTVPSDFYGLTLWILTTTLQQWSFYFSCFQLEHNSFTTVLVSAVQCESAHVCIYPLPLEPLSHSPAPPHPLGHHRAPGWAPCAAASHWLSVLHIRGYVCQCYSPNASHPLLPPLCPQVCSLRLHLYSCPANRFISTVFLDSMFMGYYMIFVFLFLTYFTLYDRLSVHPHHYKWLNFVPFIWLSNIPLYTGTTSSLSIPL